MIDFNEAYNIVLGNARHYGEEQIALKNALGRVTLENWYADRDFPPYDRVTMDGIAVSYDNIKINIPIKIEGIAAAGDSRKILAQKTSCLEVMTGSILPHGTDTIIRYEDVDLENGFAIIRTAIKKGQNIHRQGEDRTKGDLLIPQGARLSPVEIGVAATIGKSQVLVSRLPKTILISTGNELVDIEKSPAEHQIRKSNIYCIESALLQHGIVSDAIHLDDEYKEIVRVLTRIIKEYDLVIMSGGVSKGKFDYLPKALDEIGVQKLFHRVKQRPGKPFWFGYHSNGCRVFALPGNPVSTFMCTQVYILSWLRACLKENQPTDDIAVLVEDVRFPKELTYFMEVKLSQADSGVVFAKPQKGNGSGDLVNLAQGDAFIKFPAQDEIFKKGTTYPIYRYR